MQHDEHWTAGYVGIPFIVKGRSLKGLDCWGLVQRVLVEQFMTYVPSLDGAYTEISFQGNAQLIEEQLATCHYQKTDNPIEGDIVVLEYAGVPYHVGIYCTISGTPMVLHTDPFGRGTSRLSRISDPTISTHVEGYYRVV